MFLDHTPVGKTLLRLTPWQRERGILEPPSARLPSGTDQRQDSSNTVILHGMSLFSRPEPVGLRPGVQIPFSETRNSSLHRPSPNSAGPGHVRRHNRPLLCYLTNQNHHPNGLRAPIIEYYLFPAGTGVAPAHPNARRASAAFLGGDFRSAKGWGLFYLGVTRHGK